MDASKGYEPCIKRVAELVDEKCPGGCKAVKAIGFKTVMAGDTNRTCRLDGEVLKKMEEYSTVAPAHNTPYIEAVKIAEKIFPSVFKQGFLQPAGKHARVAAYCVNQCDDRYLCEVVKCKEHTENGYRHGLFNGVLENKDRNQYCHVG